MNISISGTRDEPETHDDNTRLSYSTMGLIYNANCPICDIPFNTDNDDYRFCPKCGRFEWNNDKKP
jgi:hypothetical protein